MIQIDQLTVKDTEALSPLLEELSGFPSNPALIAETVLLKMDSSYFILGARYMDELAGTIMGIRCHDLVGECRPFMVLENLIVLEKYRGNGIARLLLEAIEKKAEELNCLYISFVSGSSRNEAHKIYESLGYSKDNPKGFRKFLD